MERIHIKKSLLITLLSLSITHCTPAKTHRETTYLEDQKTAVMIDKYIEQGNYTSALPLVKQLAEQGYAAAQFHLGMMYHKGHGTDSNETQAIYWYKKAAEQGYPSAQQNLGNMYYSVTDYDQAVYWWEKAATQGVDESQYNLALMYEDGLGNLEQSYKKAIYWYTQAAKQEHAISQHNLALLHMEGKGLQKDKFKAKLLFKRACNNGYSDACHNYAILNKENIH